MKQILFDVAVVTALVAAAWYIYFNYGEQISAYIFDDTTSTMYVESTPIKVTIADELREQKQGLSGVVELGQFEGKLFIFPQEDFYSMWMKDMLFPIDIFWINNNMRVVHIEQNVSPDTYPDSFTSTEPARFVLETSAFFAQNANIAVGDEVVLPANHVPRDLLDLLQ